MKNQRGVAITGLLLWGFVIVIVALLGMKVVPEYICLLYTSRCV